MKKYQNISSEIFHFLVVKFSVYLNRRVFVMSTPLPAYRFTGQGKIISEQRSDSAYADPVAAENL